MTFKEAVAKAKLLADAWRAEIRARLEVGGPS